MERFFRIIILVIFIIGLKGGCFAAQKDFRNTRWGMTKIEVMASEESKPELFAGPVLTYRTVMLGKEMYLIYEFIENKLIDAIYVFITQSDQDYLQIEEILTRKYGKTVIERNEGSMDYYYMWETHLTEIVLKSGAGKDCRIEYLSKKLKKFREKQETKKSIDREKEIMNFF